MLYIYSSNIRTGKFEELQRWIVAYKEKFAAAQPEAWTLQDIYFTAFGLGTAHLEIHWEIKEYGALDLARQTAQSRGPFFELLTALHSHLDPATGSGRILKQANSPDALIVGC